MIYGNCLYFAGFETFLQYPEVLWQCPKVPSGILGGERCVSAMRLGLCASLGCGRGFRWVSIRDSNGTKSGSNGSSIGFLEPVIEEFRRGFRTLIALPHFRFDQNRGHRFGGLLCDPPTRIGSRSLLGVIIENDRQQSS